MPDQNSVVPAELGIYFNSNKQLVTTSLKVAERFGKEHKHVLEAIRNLDCSEEFRQSNFRPSEYLNSQGKLQPYFEMTRDGFSFLAMGFTGREAAKWKEAYIKAFNAMEAETSERRLQYNMTPLMEQMQALDFLHRSVASITGVDGGIAAAQFLATVTEVTGLPTHHFRQALPTTTAAQPSLNPTKIGEKLGISAKMVNLMLADAGLQIKNERKAWELTAQGSQYGAMLPYSRNGHTDYQVLWFDSVVDVLRGAQ